MMNAMFITHYLKIWLSLCTGQCQKGWSGCVCLDATEENVVQMLTSLQTGNCVLTLDSGVALSVMVQSALRSGTPSSALVIAAVRLMGLLAAQSLNSSDEYTQTAMSSYLSIFAGVLSSFLNAGVQQAVQRDATLSYAIATLLAHYEKLNIGLTRRVHLADSSPPARLSASVSAILVSATRLRTSDIGDGTGFVFPNPQDAGTSGGHAAQNPAERVTLLPSAMQTAGALARGPDAAGFVAAQVTLFDSSLNALLPTNVSKAALSQMNGSTTSVFSRVLSVSLDPPVASDGSDIIEITFMFVSPLNESNQTLHCAFLDTCVHSVLSVVYNVFKLNSTRIQSVHVMNE